jgi:hypothetical protein
MCACCRGFGPAGVVSDAAFPIKTAGVFPFGTGTAVGIRKALVISVRGTAAKTDSFGQMEAITRARALIRSIDVKAGDDTVARQGGDGPGGGVFGDADGGTDVSDTDWGDPTLFAWLGLVGEFFEDCPGEGAEPAPPCSALRVEDYLAARAGHLLAPVESGWRLPVSRAADSSSRESRSLSGDAVRG